MAANLITTLGLILTAVASAFIAKGDFLIAAGILLTGGICDLLDGRVARMNPNRSPFGALYDSSVDRYSDAFIFGGLLCYFARLGNHHEALLAFSALIAAFAISYVRARSEGLGTKCSVGFWERFERFAAVLMGLVTGHVVPMIWILGLWPHLTVIERLLHSNRQFSSSTKTEAAPKNRLSPLYLLQTALIILIILFVD